MAVYTQAELDAARAAFATGVLSYTYEYDGKRHTKTYRSLSELRSIIDTIQSDVVGAETTRSYVTFGRD